MNNNLKLFVKINEKKIFIFVLKIDENENVKIVKDIIFDIDQFGKNMIYEIDKISNTIKKNILIIEQELKFTFKDVVVILDNYEVSYLNITGFKKLNGTQVSKENITYILNSLKSTVDTYEVKRKILHIFNSKYLLDKKKINNLPIGLFGDFYAHELSFNMIDENDYKNLNLIFEKCNLKIKRILLESFVKGSYLSDLYPQIENFYYIKINEKTSKIIFVENDSIKFEQKFQFGSEIISKDISKITSLNIDTVEKIIDKNKDIHEISEIDLIEEEYFTDSQFRKVKKKLIQDIAKARIKELGEFLYFKNINFKKFNQEKIIIFLEICNKSHLNCFKGVYQNCFNYNDEFEVKLFNSGDLKDELDAADKIVQYGWRKEAIPMVKAKKSFFSRIFRSLFQ